jgi:Big-like domain-containing protein
MKSSRRAATTISLIFVLATAGASARSRLDTSPGREGIGTVVTSGTRTVTSTTTIAYPLTATSGGGSTTASTTVTVSAAMPTATIGRSPASIPTGQSSTLSWSTSIATSASIDRGIDTLAASDSRSVSQAATTTDTVRASNTSGLATKSTNVIVTALPSGTGPQPVGSQVAGTFADATGHSAQSHLVYAANAGVWWLFTLTSKADSVGGSNHVIKAFYSSGSDLSTATWTAASDSPGASASASSNCSICFMGGGRALGIAYVNNAPVDVVHAELAMAADGANGLTAHIRAKLTANSVTWESWNYHDEPAATWTLPRAVTLGVSSGKFIHSAGPILQQEVDANARKSNNADTGNSWTSGFSNVSVIDNSMTHANNALAFAPLTGTAMLAVYDNGGGTSTCLNCGQNGAPEPNLTNLNYKRSNSDGSWPSVTVGSQSPGDGPVFGTDAVIDQNDWALVGRTTSAIYAFRRNAKGNGVDAAAYSPSTNTWSASTAPAPFGSGQGFKSGAGLFGATDSSSIWLFVVNTDAANSILYSKFDGTAWSPWAAVPGTTDGTHSRAFVAGAPIVTAGQVGLTWTEGPSPYNVFAAALPTGGSTTPTLPTGTITANPPSIAAGASSTLSWTTTNATSVSIDQGIGAVAATGSLTVTPSATTTYTMTVTNSAGSTTATATVTVASETLTISNVTVTNLIASGATITWTTNIAGTSRVDYGTTTAYGATVSDPTLVTSHSLALSGLSASTTYHYRVTSQASGANPVSTGDLTFVTAAPLDTTPPTVVSVTPASAATGVSRLTLVTATFSEALTASTITTSTFLLVNTATSTAVAATVTYDAASKTATLKPSQALAARTTYTATVVGGTTGVTDLAGNRMTSNYVWSFTTAPRR